MDRIRQAVDSFHLPTLAVALAVAIGGAMTYNGQPVDLSTGAGRGVAFLALMMTVVGVVQKWQATTPAAPIVSAVEQSVGSPVSSVLILSALRDLDQRLRDLLMVMDALDRRIPPATAPQAPTVTAQPVIVADMGTEQGATPRVPPTSPWGIANNQPGV